jgi:hypothetical protein
MLRKIIPALASASLLVAVAMPASAVARQSHAVTRKLKMTTGTNRPHSSGTFQSFRCESTIATGPSGAVPVNVFQSNSEEFFFLYRQGHKTLFSIVTTCTGTVPKGTVVPSSIVTHNVSCSQYTPGSKKTATVQGSGISTTYPDGMYSETCNTPAYNPN